MNKMVRKQLFITAEQNRQIKTRAALTGLSEGELIRRGIDRELSEDVAEKNDDWKQAWRQAFGMWKDRDDLDEFYGERRRRRRQRRQKMQKSLRGS